MQAKPYLREVTLDKASIENPRAYPFDIPSIRSLDSITFHKDVTFIVGENGSGKSTLVEAIAQHLGLSAEGGTKFFQLETAKTTSDLHHHLKSIKSFKKPNDYYFLRAESFYNVATYMDTTNYLKNYGGKSLHEQSHGESFMAVLTHKLKGEGIYILDEPEAALSPFRQLAAIGEIHRLVGKGAQFIIATHSPILMAYPNAKILCLSEDGAEEVAYEETEHFQFYDLFFKNPKGMIHQAIQ